MDLQNYIGEPYTRKTIDPSSFEDAQIFIVADPSLEEDQADLISIELNQFGVRTHYLDDRQGYSNIFSKSRYLQTLMTDLTPKPAESKTPVFRHFNQPHVPRK